MPSSPLSPQWQTHSASKDFFENMDIASSKEADLEVNVLSALASVSIILMRQFVNFQFYHVNLLLIHPQLCHSSTAVHGCIQAQPQWAAGSMGSEEILQVSCFA